jgi:hypothetical protein
VIAVRVKSSAFAVFMLITVSNLLGCSTARSAGFAPLRILPDKHARGPEIAGEIRAIGNENAGGSHFPLRTYGGQPLGDCEVSDLFA